MSFDNFKSYPQFFIHELGFWLMATSARSWSRDFINMFMKFNVIYP